MKFFPLLYVSKNQRFGCHFCRYTCYFSIQHDTLALGTHYGTWRRAGGPGGRLRGPWALWTLTGAWGTSSALRVCPLAVLGTAYTVINDSFRYKPLNSAMLHSGGRAQPRGLHLSCLVAATTIATASLPNSACPGLRTRSVVVFEQQLNNVFRYNGGFLGTTSLVL